MLVDRISGLVQMVARAVCGLCHPLCGRGSMLHASYSRHAAPVSELSVPLMTSDVTGLVGTQEVSPPLDILCKNPAGKSSSVVLSVSVCSRTGRAAGVCSSQSGPVGRGYL